MLAGRPDAPPRIAQGNAVLGSRVVQSSNGSLTARAARGFSRHVAHEWFTGRRKAAAGGAYPEFRTSAGASFVEWTVGGPAAKGGPLARGGQLAIHAARPSHGARPTANCA